MACSIACVSISQSQQPPDPVLHRSRPRRSSPLETLDVTSLVLRRCGAGAWVPWCGDTRVPRLEYALELMFCMPSQHHAIGLQTGCMVTVLAPVG